MLSDILNEAKTILYNLPTKEQTLKMAVTDKVEGVHEMYLANIEKNFKFLLSRNNLRLLKTIKREQKRKEKEEEQDEND